MTREVVFLGTKDHALFIMDVCPDAGVSVHGFLDDTLPAGETVWGRPVLGGFSLIEDVSLRDRFDFFVAMGTSAERLKWGRRLKEAGGQFCNIIHPSCVISPDAQIGVGVLADPFVVVHADATVGDFVVLDNHTTVAHHVVLADGVNLSPGARALGGASCGEAAFIGAGAVVLPRVHVGARSIVGAGAVVIKDVPEDVTVVGNPARVVRTIDD